MNGPQRSTPDVARLRLLLAAPAFAHVAALALSFPWGGSFHLGRLDLGIAAAAAAYLLGVLLVRSHEVALRLLLVVYSALVALLMTNVVAYLALPRITGGPWPRMRRLSTVSPGVMPGIQGTVVFTVNSLGLRGPEVDLDDVDARVLCLGGSTTECLYLTDEQTWPWRLGEKLSARLGRRVFVGNAGKSGHFTLHHEYLLQRYRWASRFDLVILLSGINDLAPLLRGNYEQRRALVPEETLYGLLPGHAYYRRLPLTRALFLGTGALFLRDDQAIQDAEGRLYVRERLRRREALLRHPLTQLPAGLGRALEGYRENLRRIALLCRGRGQHLVLLTQPTLWREGLAPDMEGLLWGGATDQGAYTTAILARLMDAFNDALLEVCRTERLDCLDLASMLAKDTTVFYDDCHFNVSGAEKVAALLAEHLAPQLAEANPAREPPISAPP